MVGLPEFNVCCGSAAALPKFPEWLPPTLELTNPDLHSPIGCRVYGLRTEETTADPALINRYDYDGIFGTGGWCVSV